MHVTTWPRLGPLTLKFDSQVLSIETYKSQNVCDAPGGKIRGEIIFILGDIFLIS